MAHGLSVALRLHGSGGDGDGHRYANADFDHRILIDRLRHAENEGEIMLLMGG